jgi:hypothetical protein
MSHVHERNRLQRSSATAWTLGLSIAAALAGGCSADGENSAPLGLPAGGRGTTAAVSGSGTQAAGTSGSRAAGSSAQTSGASTLTAGTGVTARAGSPSQPSAAGSAAGSDAAGVSGQIATATAGGGAGQAGAVAMGSGGAGGAMGNAEPAGLPPGATNFTAICAGGKVGMDSDAAGKIPGLDVGREFAGVKYLAKTPNEIVSFKTTLVVPKTPTARQTLFIWPGLQSRDRAADPGRIGNGVLQPVLTWGPSCAPKLPPKPYETGWWIAGMYVNVTSGAAGPSGCAGGDYVTTSLGDWLEIDMFVKDAKSVQTVKNVQMNKTVDFTIDLKGQVQNEAMWLIEVPSGSSVRPAEDTIWLQNVLTFSQPVTSCQPRSRGSADYFSAPTLSTDGLHCCWDKIILKANRSATP